MENLFCQLSVYMKYFLIKTRTKFLHSCAMLNKNEQGWLMLSKAKISLTKMCIVILSYTESQSHTELYRVIQIMTESNRIKQSHALSNRFIHSHTESYIVIRVIKSHTETNRAIQSHTELYRDIGSWGILFWAKWSQFVNLWICEILLLWAARAAKNEN